MTNPSLSALTLRRPVRDDAARTLELMIRCDIGDYGVPDSSLEDLLFDWDHTDLARDAWLAELPAGEIAGYAGVEIWFGGLQYNLYIDPAWRTSGLAEGLLERCEERSAALVRDGMAAPLARTFVAHVNEPKRAALEAAGFRPARYHFQMRYKLDAPPPSPEWPDGVTIRTARPGQDDRAIHTLIEAAFDRPGRTPSPLEDWQDFMMQPQIFRPELWFLAEANGELAGACLCFIYGQEGWVRQLAVADGWRRRGLGTALLRHAFGEFWQRRLDHVGLGVAADNERAIHIYEAAGMRRLQQYDEYHKSIDPAT